MPFEYRIIKEVTKVVKNYDQLDIYFFKPKLTGVGIKVRFDGQRSQCWHADELELKFIKNLNQIEQGLVVYEDWKKVRMPIDLKIHTKQFLASKLSPAELAQTTLPIKKELQTLNQTICIALEKQKFSEKHFEANQDLKRWISPEHPLAEVFIVEKLKYKSFSFEQGDFRVSALYGENIKESTWETTCVESSNQQSLKQKISEYIKGNEPNISYPGLLQKIYNK